MLLLLTTLNHCRRHQTTTLNNNSLSLVVIVILLLSCYASAACNEMERASLASLSLNVSNLNWPSSGDCCSWEGVECDGNDQVIRLWLPTRGLRGSISPSFSGLTKLTQLNLSHNYFSGPLPDGFFSSFTTLQIVDLSFNSLSGSLPISDTLPIALQILDLSSNHFNGSIQSSFLWLAMNLRSFNVSNNSFTGRIPSICSSDSPLVVILDFSYNGFHGPIGEGFGACENLEVLRAGFNFLSGPIPDDIFSAGALQEIILPGNKLNGPIGESIINLANLRILALFGNEFIGSIPNGIGKLSNLEQLLLQINNLNDTLPQSLMNCTSLKVLNLRVNNFVGELSALDFSKLQQLVTVDLGSNNFNDSLPTSLFSCKALNAVRLATNRLEGEILPDIVALQSLSFLSLANNSLTNITGALRILRGYSGFRWLPINWPNSKLDHRADEVGDFPKQLVGLPELASQQIAKSIDSSYLELPVFVQRNNASNLQYNGLAYLPPAIYLGRNSLTGNIPVEIGQMKFIHILDLSNNNFSGIVPNQISTLTNLEKLDLSGNNLSWKIPASLKNLNFLSYFSVANNNLHGLIPAGGSFQEVTLIYLTRKQYLITLLQEYQLKLARIPFWSCCFQTTIELKDLTIAKILKAADNFNQGNVISCGGFGVVYKSTLENGTTVTVAVKKLSGEIRAPTASHPQ
ncbi:hypothetical protein LguiA_007937 [Lonicera macranthoides]